MEETVSSEPGASHRRIEIALAEHGFSLMQSRLGLKSAWEAGLVIYKNNTRAWNREVRTFWPPRVSTFSPFLDPEAAKDELLREYFRTYGPATIQDAAWWSALPQSRVRRFLEDAKATSMEMPWSRNTFYRLTDRCADRVALQGQFVFLAHEDVALKAYKDSRARYLTLVKEEDVYNSIGEVRSSILSPDGQVVGIWSWQKRTQAVVPQVMTQLAPSALSAINDLADSHTERLRQALPREGQPRLF